MEYDGPRFKSDNLRRGCRLQDRDAVQGQSESRQHVVAHRRGGREVRLARGGIREHETFLLFLLPPFLFLFPLAFSPPLPNPLSLPTPPTPLTNPPSHRPDEPGKTRTQPTPQIAHNSTTRRARKIQPRSAQESISTSHTYLSRCLH